MLSNEIRKLLLAILMMSVPMSILSRLFNNPMWVDIAISVIVLSPTYIRIAGRLDVKVM